MISARFSEIKLWQRILLFIVAYLITLVTSLNTENLTILPTFCPFRLLTGYPCPGCGISRSIGALIQGNVSLSLSLHPLGLLVFFVFIIFMTNPDYLAAFGKRFNYFFNSKPNSIRISLSLITLLLLWIWNLTRWDSVLLVL